MSENVIFYELIRTPQAATFPVVPFGRQSSSKIQHITFLAHKLADVTIWSKILSSILTTILVVDP